MPKGHVSRWRVDLALQNQDAQGVNEPRDRRAGPALPLLVSSLPGFLILRIHNAGRARSANTSHPGSRTHSRTVSELDSLSPIADRLAPASPWTPREPSP